MEEIKKETVEVADIQFRPGQKIYYFSPNGLTLKAGDHVIIDTARGNEFGIVTGGNHKIPAKDVVAPLRPVLRKTTTYDERIVAENLATEKRAYEVCLEKIAEYKLDMQLVSAECAFDGGKILFFFTADERVDFRELVKNLGATFHTRIELRQIGVRDKAKMVGGLGICGRPFCCASFLDDFQPVSIKMAKTQNLSLNPTKISGTCGRLMCCLKYEQDAYEDLLRSAPKADSFVDTPEGRGTIVDVNLLRQKVKVRLEKEPDTIVTCANEEIAVFRSGKAKKTDAQEPDTIVTCANEEIAVFRSGKAKKTDAPIPEDWAPISGDGKRVRKEEPEKRRFLDSIMFFEEEQATTEPVAEEVTAEEREEGAKKNNRRNRNRNRNRAEHKEAAAPVEQPKEEPQASEEAPAEGGKKNNHHRRYNRHRHHKPKQTAAE